MIAIKSASPSSSFKKGDVARAIIVRTRKETRRKDGSYIRFDDNAVALVNKDNEPLAKRIFWPVGRELREKGRKDINIERVEEALNTGADTIAVACPFCMVMMTDGVKNKEKEDSVKVFDLAELIAQAKEL